MLGAPKLRPGSLRWFATGLVVVALAVWLGCALWWEASAAGPLGRVLLRAGCLRAEYALREPLPPQLRIATLLPWPPAGMHGVECGRPKERGVIWLPEVTMCLETNGAVTSTAGANPVISAAAAAVWRTVDIPLWPAALIAAAAAVRSWRRHLRGGPEQCRDCGYDRRGLDPRAKCPECGTVPARG